MALLHNGADPTEQDALGIDSALAAAVSVGRQEAGKLVIFVVEVVGGRK
jgi:hypothetical protein